MISYPYPTMLKDPPQIKLLFGIHKVLNYTDLQKDTKILQIIMFKARSNISKPNWGANLHEIDHTTYLGLHVFFQLLSTFNHNLYFWKPYLDTKMHVHCLMVVVGLMFDDNNGPQNFPILAHSINIYYWWSRYENIGSKNSATLFIHMKFNIEGMVLLLVMPGNTMHP